MKFGDKLILLRKKKGFSQEELASKLNVSRQSVSKWESNNTYPETDKIIQICNIFDCRMDDLINDKVADVTQCERKNKNNLSIVFDSFLEFVTKSINMFTSMKFTSGLRCIIELGILVVCLLVVGLLVSDISTSIIMRLFSFLPYKVLDPIRSVISAVIDVLLICLSVIVIVHVFKIRYLDYYDKLILENKTDENEKVEEEKTTKTDKSKDKKESKFKFKLNNEPKIIIRDKHTTFAFLSTLSKIIIGIFKAFVAMVACCFIFSLVCLVATLVVSISLSNLSLLFIGIDIGLIATIVLNILILIGMIYFIINKKNNLKLMTYISLGALVVLGIGIGIGFIGFTGFEFKDTMDDISEIVSKEITIEFDDTMVIQTIGSDEYSIRIDDSMSDDTIKVVGSLDKYLFDDVIYHTDDLYGMKTYIVHNASYINLGDFFDLLYKDLENNIIRSYDGDDGTIEIVCNRKIADKLLENAKKIYLVEYKKTDNGYYVLDYDEKIYFDYNCELEYNATTGEYEYDDSCICEKKVSPSEDGELIDFKCYYIAE